MKYCNAGNTSFYVFLSLSLKYAECDSDIDITTVMTKPLCLSILTNPMSVIYFSNIVHAAVL